MTIKNNKKTPHFISGCCEFLQLLALTF
ncbi:MAG: hypothetical protein UX27_C0031G0001, partial [Candidatus Azambacteria bacterium GW2011_GWA2_45_90]